jgi:hypothetical protein
VVSALLKARQNPVVRKVDPAKLKRRPRALPSAIGAVTVPDVASPIRRAEEQDQLLGESRRLSERTLIQALLLRLGHDLGFDIWVCESDRYKAVGGKRFTDIPNLQNVLSLQLDEATRKTIELMDVLWLDGHAPVAAFRIETGTTISSGLLRMSDLIAMRPEMNISLFVVAPDNSRNRVIAEVNRATFASLNPPLGQICRFVSFRTLRQEIKHMRKRLAHLSLEYLDEISESCEAEEK